MTLRVVWDCIYPNPPEVSRYKYYNFEVVGNAVIVHGDGLDIDYTTSQFKEFFTLESGTWDDVFKAEVKKPTKFDKTAVETSEGK